MMLLASFDPRISRLIRLVGLALVVSSVVTSHHAPGGCGRGLAVSVLLGICVVAWLAWITQADIGGPVQGDSYVMAAAGGALLGASPDSAASVFVFVGIVTAGLRAELTWAWVTTALGTLGLGITVLVYDGSVVALLAYALGFAAATLAASNGRQTRQRAEQAELLLAQSQRSAEEHLRAARLQESTRIAREIHDVLSHSPRLCPGACPAQRPPLAASLRQRLT